MGFLTHNLIMGLKNSKEIKEENETYKYADTLWNVKEYLTVVKNRIVIGVLLICGGFVAQDLNHWLGYGIIIVGSWLTTLAIDDLSDLWYDINQLRSQIIKDQKS